MPRAVDHDNIRGFDVAEADKLDQAGKGNRGSRLHRDALHFAKDVNGAEGLFVGNALKDAAAALLHALAQDGVGAARVSGGEGGNVGAGGADGVGNIEVLLPGVGHGGAAGSLNAGQGRQAIDQAHLAKLKKALLNTMRAEAAANGLDVPIGGAPERMAAAALITLAGWGRASPKGWRGAEHIGKLFDHFKGDGFHRLDRRDGARAAFEVQITLAGELGGNLLGLIVRGGNLDNLGAIEGHFTHFFGRDEAGQEGPELDTRAGGISRVGDGDIAGGGQDSFSDAGFFEGGNGEGGLAVFEGGGGTLALIFDVDVGTAKHQAEVGGVNERGSAFAEDEQGVGAMHGEKLDVAPEVEGACGQDRRQDALDGIVIVASFAPLAATAGAGMGGGEIRGTVPTIEAFSEAVHKADSGVDRVERGLRDRSGLRKALEGILEAFEQILLLESGFVEHPLRELGQVGALLFGKVAGGEDDDGDELQAGVEADGFEEREAIQIGHEEIEDDGLRRVGLEGGEAGFATLGGADLILRLAFKDLLDQAQNLLVIIYDQDLLNGTIAIEPLDGFQQLIFEDGLGEIAHRAEAEALLAVFDNGTDDHRNSAGLGVLLELLQDLPAINVGHHNIEGNGKGLVLAGEGHGLRRVGKGEHLVTMVGEVAFIKVEHLAVIINRKDEARGVSGLTIWLCTWLRFSRGRQGKREGEVENAALANFTMNADAAAMQLDKQARDGEAKARAANFAGGGRVNLREGLEELVLIFSRDARTGINNGDEDLGVALRRGGNLSFDRDDAFIGEFGGIGKEVDQHLADAGGVGADNWQVGGNDFFKRDGLIFGKANGGGHGASDEVAEVDVLVEGEFHFASLDLRDIENIVDELEKVLTGRVDGGEILLLHV